ncbi:sulfatase-like hydrolase/transferase [Janthinobacterium sp. UMAB-56]|uniref:sulfatase-like hydrolase/transferase n=1 Tax=Janthinobacterium sp. UMAB-56 TaxID=1365361 RepID=UPI001C55DB0F|nr:sulfatase-like hydrolase/transferase [Janthinobacterium sp. UMAB-56]
MYDHIVLLSIDTLRSDCIGRNPLKLWPAKYPHLSAPDTSVLDALVDEGAFFANCVSAAPYTSASHASILNGKWPLRHGVYEFFNKKLSGETLFTRAQRSGYRTILKSDFPLILGPTLGFDRGIDHFLVENDDAYLAALGQAERSVSLAHFGGVHVPYGFHNLQYGGDAYRSKLAELEKRVGTSASLPKDQLFETLRDEEDMQHLMRYKRVIQELWKADRAEDIFGLYLEGIEHFLRYRFAPFMAKLRQRLAGKRWLIVLFGDHGEEYDEQSFGHFNSVAEGVLRVPLLFIGDDVAPAIHTERVRTVDILPTILDLNGERRRQRTSIDGISLAATVRDRMPYTSRHGYAQAYVADTARFVKFQQRMLSHGKKQGHLPHLLFKETVWDGKHKFSRTVADFEQYLGGMAPIDPIHRLERFNDAHFPQPSNEASIQQKLAEMLVHYNTIRA